MAESVLQPQEASIPVGIEGFYAGCATKRCSRCHTWKAATQKFFARNRALKDGWHNQCKLCACHSQRASRIRCAAYNRYADRKRDVALRLEFLRAYGEQCACCGIRDCATLTLDHVKRDGAAHRAKKGGTRNILRELKSKNWPQDDYRLLCMNCQLATAFGRSCPHQAARPALREINPYKNNVGKRKWEARWDFIQHFGARCQNCGETEFWFLTIEHRNGGGRRESGNSWDKYQRAVAAGIPEDLYSCLCANCNWKDRFRHMPHVMKYREVREVRDAA